MAEALMQSAVCRALGGKQLGVLYGRGDSGS